MTELARRRSIALVVAAAVLLGLFSIVAGSWPRYPKIAVLVGFVAIIGVGRKSTTVLGAAGVGVVLLSIFADDLGLGSRRGIGRWQETGLVIGVLAVLGSGLWQIAKRDWSSEPVDGQNDSSSSEDLSLWGRRGTWVGGVAVALSLYLGDPYLAGGVLGWWRVALVALGLLAIGAGLVAVLWHSVWRTAVKATLVAVTVAALSVSVVAWDQVPPAAPSCSEVEWPTVESRSFYCYEGKGTLVRMSIAIQNECGASESTLARRGFRGLMSNWWFEGNAVGCKL